MSVKLELLAQEWHQLKAQIEGHENALKEHLKSDWVAVKERYEGAIEHFREKFAHVESKLPKEITDQLKGGQSALTAVQIYVNPPPKAVVEEVKPAPEQPAK